MLPFNTCTLLNEHGHELPEQLTHDIHTLLTGGHVVEGVAHGEEDSLYAARVGCVVQFGISL